MSADEIVSVIMPCYNGAKTLSTTLDSVLKQTYEQYRVYVVDDGSTDATPEILLDYQNRYPDKITVFTQVNQGQTKAKNYALSKAKGSLIALIDSDDLWHQDKLQAQVDVFVHNSHVGLCYTNGAYINEHGDKTGVIGIDPKVQGHCLDRLMMGNAMVASSVMFRHDLIKRVGNFDTALTACENWELWTRISRIATLYAIDEELVYYRRHQHNMSLNFEKLKTNRLKVIEKNQHLYHDIIPNIRYHSRRAKYEAYRFFGENYLWHLNIPQARSCLLRAAITMPFQLNPYKLLLKSLLGKTLITKIRHMRGGKLASQL